MKVAIFIAIIMASMVAGQQQSLASFINDNNVLNYALTLENLEAAYYQQGLNALNESAFNASGFPQGVRAAISVIAAQEADHARTLTSVLGARGWPAVTPCNYTFTFTDARSFVSLLATIEGLGTEAYVGAAIGLTNKDLLNTAAGIASVEARHTAFINYLLGQNVFPDGNQTNPASFQKVTAAVTPFFASCTPVTLSTTYNGSITVSSTTFASYQWQPASSYRFPSQPVANFYNPQFDGSQYINGNATILNSDASVLNYALVLERLESNFYQTFNQSFTPAAILADYPGLNTTLANLFSSVIGMIGEHEIIHVNTLSGALAALSQAPGATFSVASACSYNWTALNPALATPSNVSFTTFLQVAYTLESTGVKAYNGAVDKITVPSFAQTAASIHTVEAEHTAFLAQLFQPTSALNVGNGTTVKAFDAAYDAPDALNTTAVVNIVGPLLAPSCLTGVTLPGNTRVNIFNDANNNAGAPFNTATGTNANTNNGGATGTVTGTNANTNNGGATGTVTGTNANTNNGGTATGTNNGTSGSASFIALSMIVAAFSALVM